MTVKPTVELRPSLVATRFRVKHLTASETEPTSPACPACTHAERNATTRLLDGAGTVAIERSTCRACDHFWFSRMPSQEWFSRLYREEFDTEAPPPARPPRLDYGGISDVLTPYLPGPDASILDVGCGYGSALQHFLGLGYRNVVGMEPSDRRVTTARSLGVPIAHGSAERMLDDPIIADRIPFDAAFSWHAFEHIFDPGAAIAHLAKVIKPGGHLFIAVPHADAEHLVQMAHYLPHIHSFTEASMRALLERNGFEVVHLDNALRVVGRRTDSVPSPATADNGGVNLRAKLVRDFGLRALPDRVDGQIFLRYSDYRGGHDICEPSYGSVSLVAKQPPHRRAFLRAADVLARSRPFAGRRDLLRRPLAAITPSVLATGRLSRPSTEQPPRVDFRYAGTHVPAWFK